MVAGNSTLGSRSACPTSEDKIAGIHPTHEETPMSKGIDQKRETKKKPQHTKDEKRALKREKKRLKGQM
jgi:hypothetical protein